MKGINNTKDYYVIAGVNGSGKSSLYALSKDHFPSNWINSDNIVRKIGGMEGWKDVKIQIAAGKQAIRDIDKNMEEGNSFVQETTLCEKSIFEKINSAKEKGYNIHLYYVGIENADLAKDRVKLRMINGGHGIPDKDIERRYGESLHNFKENINLFNDIHVYSNTSGMKLIFTVENNKFKIHEESTESWCIDLMNTCLQKA